MRLQFKLILTILLFLSQHHINRAEAQNQFHFSHFGVEDGLSQSNVLHIFQDSDGFLWFATRNGINKFNGYEFISFQNEVNNPQSLSSGVVRVINEDKNKNLWIGTDNGLNRLDYIYRKITRFYPSSIDASITSNAVNLLFRHSNGQLFAICGNHLLLCNLDNTVELYRTLTDITSPILAIAQDNRHKIYIATQGTIFIYSHEWVLVQKLTSGIENFPEAAISYFLPDSNGVWIGTAGSGVYYFDTSNQTFTSYNTNNSGLSNNSVRALQLLNENTLLIGTFDGLNVMNVCDRSISPVGQYLGRAGELRHYSIHSLLVDNVGTLWVGTYAAGISYASPYKKAIYLISSDEHFGIIGRGQEDRNGNLWFATEGGGLFFYNPNTSEQRLYPLRPLSPGNRTVNIFKSLLIDGDIVYCGIHLGAVYTFHTAERRYELLHDFRGYGIWTMMLDSKRRLWIATGGSDGLVVSEQGVMTPVFHTHNGTKRRFFGVRSLLELDENTFVIGTNHGQIFLYDKNNLTVENIHEQIPLGKHERIGIISSIVKDDSYIYIATTQMGLFRFDHNLQLIKQFNAEDGLASSFIASLVIDNNQTLWVATGNDIFRLNQNNDRFYSISPRDSFLQELAIGAAFVSSEGILYFPGNRGVITFNPQQLRSNPIVPPVFITSLISNNQDITYRIRRQRAANQSYSITLRANQNNLTIRYTALNYIHSAGNRYMIKMDNIDDVWHNAEGRREVYYSNLRPGRHVFRLRASNNDGVWNPQETTLSIYVKPPFYMTGWAYAVYALFLLAIIVIASRYQRKKFKLESEIRFKQKEKENLKELHSERMRMYANFSHELKTPLTLMMNPLQKLLEKSSFSQEVKSVLHKIVKNTDKMMLLVDKLMDVQKYEAGKNVLNKKTFDFSPFVAEIYEAFQPMAQQRDIHFSLSNELPYSSYLVCLDKAEIEKVFSNLLSNAFKFTPSDGRVTITIRSVREKGNRYLSIQIADTGQGFSEEEEHKIFEPFYQFGNDLHRQISGTGIGLSLVRSIITHHNGLIRAHSEPQVGSTFTVLLPDTEKQSIGKMVPLSEKQQQVHDFIGDLQNKKTILLVDNEIEMLDYLEEELAPSYLILKAENGKKALAVLEEAAPDLIISDIVMPEMDGIALCKYLKKHQQYSRTPIILLTAKSGENQKIAGFDVGADAYVTKPFNPDFLKARIKNLIENRKQAKLAHNDFYLLEMMGIDKAQYKNKFVERYIEFLKANMANQNLGIRDICKGLGISRANFYRKINSVTKLAPKDVIKQIRLHASIELLLESDKNLAEIAQLVGFFSRTGFSRTFKEEYGMTPSEYQRRYRR